MYKFNEIKKLHIEISTLCQAKCPMCARNYHGGLPNPLLTKANIDLEKFTKFLDPSFIKQLEYMVICGNFGDPILNDDLVPIVDYIAQSNPNIDLEIHTNGSARPLSWWKDLAKALPNKHVVHFGIDGLEDTHSLYRIGTDFNKIIENAKAFISAGGKARWSFITFLHNEHQIEQCRKMAKDLGFDSFYEKQSSRFIGDPWFDVLDKSGKLAYRLENPTDQKLVVVDNDTIKNYKEIIKNATIDCEAESTYGIYIDAYGHLWPCCWTAAVPYIYIKPDEITYEFQEDNRKSLAERLKLFGGIEKIDLSKRTIEEIVNSVEWQTIWNEGFKDKKPLVCARMCGKFDKPTISQCRDQYINLDKFSDV